MSKGRNFRCRHDQIPSRAILLHSVTYPQGLLAWSSSHRPHAIATMSHFYWGPRPPPIDVCLDWPELVPVPSGGEIYGGWDYISEGLDATLFPPKSLQSVLVCLPRCRKALTGAVCHTAFHQLSLVADFIYLQDPSPAAFRQISMAITRQARLNSIRYREEREYRYLPDARLDWDELPASTCRVRTCERFGKPFSSIGSLRIHLRRSAFHKVPYVVTCWSLPPKDRLKMADRLHFIMSRPVLYKGLEGVLARCRPCPPLQPPLRVLPRPWPQLSPRPPAQTSLYDVEMGSSRDADSDHPSPRTIRSLLSRQQARGRRLAVMSDDNDDGNIPAPRLATRPLAGRQFPCFLWILAGSLWLSTSP